MNLEHLILPKERNHKTLIIRIKIKIKIIQTKNKA